MHNSLPVSNCEFINIEGFSPLISKCQIKVLYERDEPNRNGTVIDKETAIKLARGLRGCPIVGFYVDEKKDFNKHDKEIYFDEEGNFKLKELTKPYGFVDINAEVWFQQFLDDDGITRNYLVTNGFLWTSAYPEAQRIINNGNNQSMEINKKSVKGFWAEEKNSYERFFIINDGIIEKLCILGEDVEPCFEGSQIKSHFSLDDEFKNTLFQMAKELKEVLNEGGQIMENEFEKVVEEQQEEPAGLDNSLEETAEVEAEVNDETEFADKKEEEKPEEAKEEEAELEGKEPEEEKKKYSLEEIPEYCELLEKYNLVTTELESLKNNYSELKTENENLNNFKKEIELKDKQAMIDNFAMLSDEDKQDVIEHINDYSLDEIEAKLSVICFRNKISFATLEETEEEKTESTSFSLSEEELDDTPAWLKAVEQRKKNY